MSMIQQLLIVAGALIALTFLVKLLWRLYLFPLGCWLVATRLFWPKWAAVNETLSGILLAASILVFNMLVLTGLVKGADRIVREMFSL